MALAVQKFGGSSVADAAKIREVARRIAARVEAGNDTMLAGSSVFAAGAVVSILVVLVVKLLDLADLHPFYIATH